MSDGRSSEEIKRGYPPSKATMIRRCTAPITGEPNEWLFDQVTQELLDYLNTPGLKRSDLFATFIDTTGSFSAPNLYDAGSGRWLRGPNAKAAFRLVSAKPSTWLQILRIKDVGPDTFYDMFRVMAVRWVHRFGESLGIFTWPEGSPVDGAYFAIEKGPGMGSTVYVKVDKGIPRDVDSGAVFAFPAPGEFKIATARATVPYPDVTLTYKSADLSASATSVVRLNVGVATPILRIGVNANSLRVFHDPEIEKVSIHAAKNSYPAKHRVTGSAQLFDKNGTPCGSCNQFAFIKQEDLEGSAVQTVTTDPEQPSVVFRDLPPDRYVVAGHSSKGIIVTTVRDVLIDDDTVREVGLDHTFDLSRLGENPPPMAFLQGDVIRQHQRDTRWCGPYSLAHAFSYWAPTRFNPREDNGKWAGETIRDAPTTWLHLVLGFATFGLSYVALDLFADDPVPGTLQDTMVRGAHKHGFSSQGLSYKSLGKAEALKQLKRWIYAGVPVIVTIDEKMDKGDGHWSSEHYKTLVGYDDLASLRYTDDNGDVHTSTGAFYFINSGAMGETRSDPEVLSPELRETHADYNRVPIGNDADSYTVFWQKWKTGSIPTFSKSHWCLPVFPVDFRKVYKPKV